MPARARFLLLDLPLGLLVGLVSLGTARASAMLTTTTRGPYLGPPWMQPGHRASFPHVVHIGEPYTWSALLWGLIIVIGIAGRRIRPFTGYALTVVGATGYLAVGLPFGPVLFAPALGLLALANRMPVRTWVTWAVLLLPLIWAGFVGAPDLGFGSPNFYAAIILGPPLIMVPALIATMRRMHIDENQRIRDQEVRRATYQERLRIARDVHDLIGHSLSVINMQAGVALYLLDKDRQLAESGSDRRVEDSLQAIRSTSKNALDELRATLAVFRGEAMDGRAPVSGLARLPELVDSFRSAGRTVTVRTEGRLDDLPGPVDNAAYRVLQEALTNVARHAGGADAQVVITRTDTLLVVEVTDNGPGVPRSGRETGPRQVNGSGLIGMSERARAVGGEVIAGPRFGGGFAVHAEFPIRKAETPA
ncbi:MAG: sensor histidine kinase [Microlunatus sp.]|nr:sensor histidine kinase [Microlunatus sp.]